MTTKIPTEDEIVQTLYEGLDDEYLKHFKDLTPDELISLHHSLGQYIRNTYGLWKRPWTPKVKDGVDMAEDHPDAISMRIIEKLHTKLHDEDRPPEI